MGEERNERRKGKGGGGGGGGRVLTVSASDGLTSTTRCRRSCSSLFLFSKMIFILPC